MSRTFITALSLLSLLVLWAPACETSELADCAPGLVLNDGACVPAGSVCGPGTELSDGVCVPVGEPCSVDCAGRICGDDGCGGTCGACANGESCTPAGTCESPLTCLPACFGKECGDDGCGGTCGTCPDPARSICDTLSGTCVAQCIPDCRGRDCGDDGCGGTCGECDANAGCSVIGHCVPDAWTCAGPRYGTQDQCDCGCGVQDPDCANGRLALVGCEGDATCVAGACAPRVPVAWTCSDLAYDDGILCDCACGVPDPDCADRRPVSGCESGETCDASGQCAVCVADCTNRVCGDDGCGGSCGDCPGDTLACIEGACTEGCFPSPILCDTNQCGDDGCGGSCGDCPGNTFCRGGECQVLPGMSCAGYCNAEAPGGCGCDQGCIAAGDCCPDYVAQCVCIPECGARTCGDDGCGGTCGRCLDANVPFCGPTGICQATCSPSCGVRECGDDGCGGQCGACGDGESCNTAGLCAPATWSCADFYFGDGGVCDCGCGAPDPDCTRVGLTSGCPVGAECNDTSGYCDVGFCNTTSECRAPGWCVGHYLAGDARQRGVCQPPQPAGAPSGVSCASDFGCATGLCANGICRDHCGDDDDCGVGQTCIGFGLIDWLSLDPLGVVSACDGAAQIGATCARQSDCAGGSTCLVFIDPATLSATYRCGVLPGGLEDENQPCDGNWACADGLVCVDEQCMRACPSGQGDCPPRSTCGTGVLHGGASPLSSDDALADICVPD